MGLRRRPYGTGPTGHAHVRRTRAVPRESYSRSRLRSAGTDRCGRLPRRAGCKRCRAVERVARAAPRPLQACAGYGCSVEVAAPLLLDGGPLRRANQVRWDRGKTGMSVSAVAIAAQWERKLPPLVRAMRPRQFIKNAIVITPLVFSVGLAW